MEDGEGGQYQPQPFIDPSATSATPRSLGMCDKGMDLTVCLSASLCCCLNLSAVAAAGDEEVRMGRDTLIGKHL